MKGRKASAVIAIAFAVAFLFVGVSIAQEEPKGSFSIHSSDIFYPGGPKPYVNINARDIKKIEFRVYKLKDPMEFFKYQTDFHSPSPGRVGKKITPYELIDEFNTTARKRYRGVLQVVTNSDAREKAVDSFGIQLDGPPSKKPKKYPILSKKAYELKAQFSYTIKSKKMDEWEYERVDIPVKGKGAYLIEAVTPEMAAYSVVLVTGLRFIDKTAPGEKMLFICDGKTGRPVSGATVLFIEGYTGKEPVEKKTGDDGIVKQPRTKGRDIRFLIKSGDDFLPGDPYYYESEGEPFKAYIYTDRPVYRPNHTVHFKALMRREKGMDYELLAGKEVNVKIYDDNYDKVYEKDLKTSDMGTLVDSYTLGAEPALGDYSIELSIDENTAYGRFKVEEYQKPEYLVAVKTGEKSYVAGDKIKVSVKADYYFGEPVAEAKVEYFVYQSRYYIPWWREYASDYQYSWYYSGSEEYETYGDDKLIEKGEGTLDENGRFSFEIPDRKIDFDSAYRIVAKVTDKNRREIAGQTMAKVSRGLYSIRMSTRYYAYARKKPVSIKVATETIDGKAVKTKLKYSLDRHYWFEDKKGHWTDKVTHIRSGNIATNKKGETSFKFTPAYQGSYKLTVSGKDKRGNTLSEEYFVYIYSTDESWYSYGGSDSIKISPDKKGYQAGDKARLIITSPVKDPTILITIENDKIYEHKVVTIKGTTFMYELDVKPEYAPNIFVDFTIVSNMDYLEGEQEIAFPPLHKFLNITLDTDKKVYKPGDDVKVTVDIRDEKGDPVEAEFSAGIVDEAIYAVAEDKTPDIRKFFYGKRYNSVQTDFAYSFYTYGRSRTLKQNLALASARIGRADMKGDELVKVRKNFKDTMHWAPSIRTGKDGKAEFTAKCPDNLTTWRITVRAADAQTRVAEQTLKFRERKDLLLRLVAPRFFRERDTVILSTTVHNYLKTDKRVKVTFKADGLQLEPSGARNITIPKRGNKRLDWRAVVYPGVKEVTLTARAISDEESDAVQVTIPFLPYGMKMSETDTAELGRGRDSDSIPVTFPDGVEMKDSQVRVEISPTPAAAIFSSLDYLIAYPYGCVEQTMSSFLPNIIVSRALGKSDIKDEPRFKKLPDMVAKGLRRLYNFQHGDGGWGWWENDETDPYMTAYVVQGFAFAKAAGYEVSESAYQRGVQSLITQLGSLPPETKDATVLYMVYALSLTGNKDTKMAKRIYEIRNKFKINDYSRALLVLALKNHGLDKEAAKVAAELSKAAKKSPGGRVYWGSNDDYWWWDDSIETTAQVVRALAAVNPDSKMISPAIKWLIANRRGGNAWRSTRDTAAVVFALLDYAKATGEGSASVTANVSLNGAKKMSRSFSEKDAFSQPWIITLDGGELKAKNSLGISKSGAGRLYVTVTKTWYDAETPIPAKDNGVRVYRTFRKIKAAKSGDQWIYGIEDIADGTLAVGDEVLVTVRIESDVDHEYFMLEDMLPAGFDVVRDTRGYNVPGVPYFSGQDYNNSWYSNMEIRDQKVSSFWTWLWKGSREFYYIMRAVLPGEYNVMPAKAERMYYPEINGNSDGRVLKIIYPEEAGGQE